MKNVISILVVAMLVALLSSCAPPKADVAAIKASIEEYNKVLAEAMVAGDDDKIMSYYAEGAISLPANGPMLRGTEEIKKNADQMHELGIKITAAKFTTVEVDADGNLAYEVGTYDMSIMGKTGTIDDNGKYLSIWKKQADGSWKVAVEIWNSSKEIPGQ